jgi:hypothetical protein
MCLQRAHNGGIGTDIALASVELAGAALVDAPRESDECEVNFNSMAKWAGASGKRSNGRNGIRLNSVNTATMLAFNAGADALDSVQLVSRLTFDMRGASWLMIKRW